MYPPWEATTKRTELDGLSDEMSQLCRDLSDQVLEFPIAEEAARGRAFTTPAADLFFTDLMRILNAFVAANGSATLEMGEFVCKTVPKLSLLLYVKVSDNPRFVMSALEKASQDPDLCEIKLPNTLMCLVVFDQKHGTQHAVSLAKYYLKYISALSTSGDSDFTAARQYVLRKYSELLEPYAIECAEGGDNGSSAANSDGSCNECAKHYAILRLPPDASKSEMKTAYRNLAQIYHPDRFQGNNESLRRTAEEELKLVNLAYSHVMGHFSAQKEAFGSCSAASHGEPEAEQTVIPSPESAVTSNTHRYAAGSYQSADNPVLRYVKVALRTVWRITKIVAVSALCLLIAAIILLQVFMFLYEHWKSESRHSGGGSRGGIETEKFFAFLNGVTWLPQQIWQGLVLIVTIVFLALIFAGKWVGEQALANITVVVILASIGAVTLLVWVFAKERKAEFEPDSTAPQPTTVSWVLGLVVDRKSTR